MTGGAGDAEGFRRTWLPPFLVGVAAAAAAEVAVALLLYSGPGLVRALTWILAAELIGLGFGLWSAPPPPRHERGARVRRPPGLLASVRRRWLFALVAFSAAAGFAGAWPIVSSEGMTAVGQGLGLALLGVLPLYGAGAVLGALAAGSGRPGRVAVSGTFGAAAGVLGTGALLTGALRPVTLLILCVAVLAAGALLDAPGAESTPGADVDEPTPDSDPDVDEPTPGAEPARDDGGPAPVPGPQG